MNVSGVNEYQRWLGTKSYGTFRFYSRNGLPESIDQIFFNDPKKATPWAIDSGKAWRKDMYFSRCCYKKKDWRWFVLALVEWSEPVLNNSWATNVSSIIFLRRAGYRISVLDRADRAWFLWSFIVPEGHGEVCNRIASVSTWLWRIITTI